MRLGLHCCGFCHGDFYLLHRFKNGIFTRITVVVILCLLIFVLCIIFSKSLPFGKVSRNLHQYQPGTQMTVDMVEAVAGGSSLQYGVVVDCGSSGSRVFVYSWPPHDGSPHSLLNIQPVKDSMGELAIMKIEPGISSFVLNPSEASKSLEPLLDYALDQVPEEKHQETPLYIMATAGMRLLSESDQEGILSDLRVDIPLKYPLLFSPTHVEVIAGKQEAIYAWVAVNYVLGKFDHDKEDGEVTAVEIPGTVGDTHLRERTVGMLDMGGASLQVAYEVTKSENIAKNALTEFNLGCTTSDTDHTYRVYVATYLGYGGNSAIEHYQEQMIINTAVPSITTATIRPTGLKKSQPIPDPCLPLDMMDQVEYRGSVYHFRGSGAYTQCKQMLAPLLNQSATCTKQPCSINGMFQPHINFKDSEFYGFSEFYYSMDDVLRMAGTYDYAAFEHAASDYCATRWSTLESRYNKNLYPRADRHRFRYQCLKSAWMTTILHEGLGFPRNYPHLTTAQLLAGNEVQWTLGALLYKTRYYPLREMEKQIQSRPYHPSWIKEVSHAQYLLIFCFIIVLSAILIYLRRLRIVRRPELRRVPTMSYFMTEADQMEEGLVTDSYTLPTSWTNGK